MNKSLKYRPLYLVERLIKDIGVSISYVYDDLVFIEHGDVLLQFDSLDSGTLNLYINSNVHTYDVKEIEDRWLMASLTKDVNLVNKGTFSVDQIPGIEEISITFNNN